jgi:PKD repeat protein
VDAEVDGRSFTLWSLGNKTSNGATSGDIDRARAAAASRDLSKGTYSYGTWILTIAGENMEIRCPSGVDPTTVTRITKTSPQIVHQGSLETTVFGVPTTTTQIGTLGPGDTQLDDGTYFDTFPMEFLFGDEVQMFLSSSDFDAALIVADPVNNFLSDDDSGGLTNSYLSFTVTQSGTYWIFPTGLNQGIGSYSITITVTRVVDEAQLVTAPVADYTASVARGTAPLTVQFTSTTTGSVDSYYWDFGDGGTSTLANPSHTFTTAGTYAVVLTATNAGGSTSARYSITATSPVPTPVASFRVSVSSGSAPLTVQFTNASTGTGNSYVWSFGDGTTSTAVNPSHTYSNPGTYTVRLTATNAGGSNSTTRSIAATAAQTKLLARAVIGNRKVASPMTVEVGSTLRFEVSTFTKADTSDLQTVTDYTWQVPSRLGRATSLGQMSVTTTVGRSDTIIFQRQSIRTSFLLNVSPAAVSQISVTPNNVSLAPGNRQQFTAQALDRYGNRVPGQSFSWYVVGNIGTIDPSTGLFTAGNSAGRGFIIVGTIVNGTIVFGDKGASASGAARLTVTPTLPDRFVLHQNTPNPFNPSTEISFDTPVAGPVRLTVYNLVGQEVEELVDQPLPAGSHRVRWNATGQSTGVYIYILESGTYREQRKMLLVR